MQSPSNEEPLYEATGEDITPEDSVVPVFTAEGPTPEDLEALAAEALAREEARIAHLSARASARERLGALGLSPAEVDSILGPESGAPTI